MDGKSDISGMISMLKTMMSDKNQKNKIENLLSQLMNAKDNSECNENVEFDEKCDDDSAEGSFNFDNIAMLQNVMQNFNSINPKHIKFLNAIKPYLSCNRQEKLEKVKEIIKFVQLMKIMKSQN